MEAGKYQNGKNNHPLLSLFADMMFGKSPFWQKLRF